MLPAAVARSNLTPALQLSLRSAVAAGLAVGIAPRLGLQFPLYALIAAVIVTDLSASRTRQLALPRLAGTVPGATLGAVIDPFLQPAAWAVALSVLAAIFLSHLSRLQDAAKVAGYVTGIVILNHGDHPWFYALHRVTETVLGIGLAVLVSLVPKLLRTDEPNSDERRAP
jgi:uncharacterized membrane protein YgaE (UPF0421/DUF939 family)